MGLDVTAYEVLAPFSIADGAVESGVGKDDSEIVVLVQPAEFINLTDGISPGRYRSLGQEVSFRVGPYSWYKVWRNQLALLILGKPAEEVCKARDVGPFVELV